MSVRCEVLREFPLSFDGVTSQVQAEGSTVAVPDALVDGLEAEGWVRRVSEAKAVPAAPENKAIEAAPQNQAGLKRRTKAAG
jgi:hypothetical protein